MIHLSPEIVRRHSLIPTCKADINLIPRKSDNLNWRIGYFGLYLISLAKFLHSYLLCLLQNTFHGVDAHVKILQGRTKGQADEVMARRVEEVPTVCWVDIEENTRDYDGLLLQQFLEESLSKILVSKHSAKVWAY